MKRTWLITITYAAAQTVILDGGKAVELTAQLQWVAETAEAARVWVFGLSSCLDLLQVIDVVEILLP